MSSIDQEDFDKTIRLTDDFFGFVNNKWLKNNPIPPEESRWGSFVILRVKVEKQLTELFISLLQKDDLIPGSNGQRIRDFYKSALDTEKLNKLGIAPLQELLAMVDSVSSNEELTRMVARLHKVGVNVFWQPSVEPDRKQSEVVSLYLYQGGLSLPDRDYYLGEGEKDKEIRVKYLSYVTGLLSGAGLKDLGEEKTSQLILEIEARLAGASMTRVELRDPEIQYNKVTLAELKKLTLEIGWTTYFKEIGVIDIKSLIVCQPNFLKEVSDIWKTQNLSEIKIYLKWHILNDLARFLSEEIERQHFDFYGRTFSGAREMKPRVRRVTEVISNMLDEAVGELYVERYFGEEAKKKVNILVDRLLAAYRARIERLSWMSIETKEKALKKLETIKKKLGYPDKWKDFSALTMGPESYAENYMRGFEFAFNFEVKKVGGPVDKNEWVMPPQTVNACYVPPMNDVTFPAGILQSPFFDAEADDAINFGGIGTVIGHEITHGFDDDGSLFDAEGNLNNWWTDEDKKSFEAKTGFLAKQSEQYEPLPGLKLNGQLTLGENTADLGGLLIAYDALKLVLKEKSDNALIDGLTPEQRFFVSYATIWRGHTREELARLFLNVDKHSPPYFRVNGPLSNLPEFYEAFGCKEGDKMWRKPEDRVSIW
jgi:putative endopeptidase